MGNARVKFISRANGEFIMQVEGAPGTTCLKVNESLQTLLTKINAEAGAPEPTAEMYATVGKDPEAFNNISR